MLTKRKQLFINHILQGKSYTESAKLSGYSINTSYATGSRLMKNVEIKNEIQRLSELERAKVTISKDTLLERLNRESLHAPRPSDRIRATELLCRIEGLLDGDGQDNRIAIFQGDRYTHLLRRVNDTQLNAPATEPAPLDTSHAQGEGGHPPPTPPMPEGLTI